MELVLHGRQGKTLAVAADVITIEKKSLLTAKRLKTIPIRHVTSVEVKKPGAFVVGFIQFSIAGGEARDSSYTLTGGAFDAVKDENSVVFVGKDNYQIALNVKTYIESWSEGGQSSPRSQSVADEIRSLKQLLDEGLLTQDEFDTKKKRLLGI